jgi:hypothetical protein
MKAHFEQHRPDVQLRAFCSRAIKARDLSKLLNKTDLKSVCTSLFVEAQELMKLEAGLADGASDIGRLKEETMALLRCDDSSHAIAERIASERVQDSASKAKELCQLLQRVHDLEQQLEEETVKAVHDAPTALAARVDPAPASCMHSDLDPPEVSKSLFATEEHSATSASLVLVPKGMGKALSTTASAIDVEASVISTSLPTTGDTGATSALHTPVAKGKGKGKGSAPKCPPVLKPPPRGKGAGHAAVSSSGGSNLLNLHWKVLNEEPALNSAAPSNEGGFLAKTAQLAASFSTSSSSSVRAARRQELRLPEFNIASVSTHDASGSTQGNIALRRDTVFSSPTDVKMMPTPLLETYFKARATARKMPGSSENPSETNENRKPLFEMKFLRMLGIMLQKHMMNHKEAKGFEVVLSIKRGVLRCDYDSVEQEKLATIYTVLREHAQSGAPLTEFVKKEGENALLRLENSLEHRLVHELLKVPQIDERLECMLFQTQFHHLLGISRRHIAALKHALEVLDSKRCIFSRFFNIALKLGQAMNRDCRAPQANRGFTLASFDKMMQAKSTKSPKHNVLHFVLALMDPDDLDQLFTKKDVELLAKAKSIKSYIAYQDCIELVQGFSGMQEICETGNYKSRSSKGGFVKMEQKRKSMCPGMRPNEAENDDDENAPAFDNDDRFHDEMKEFVDENKDDIQSIAKDCFNVFKMYKELAIYFDDVRSVYPPPRSDNDSKVDLVVVFHHLAKQVVSHREEMRQDCLRDLVCGP